MDAVADQDVYRVAEIARRLAEADDLDETLQRIVDLAADYLEPCDGVTMTVYRGGKPITPASTDAAARDADLAQYRTDEGPCLTALRDHHVIVIKDIETDDRWPLWRAEVSELGWSSMMGVRLFLGEDTMGALNLYSRTADAFDGHHQALAQVFASHASVAMKAAISEQGLHRALATRDFIGQAKGVLMERRRLSGEEAFATLRRLSSRHNIKLRDLARQIVETGEIPD